LGAQILWMYKIKRSGLTSIAEVQYYALNEAAKDVK
jgi:hypothetical protein